MKANTISSKKLIVFSKPKYQKHKSDPFSSSNLNIKKLREYHFGWGLGGAKSETHSQKKTKNYPNQKPIHKKKNKKLPKSETHLQKTRNYSIKINKKNRSIAKIYKFMQVRNLDSLKHFIKHVRSNTWKL